jgi:membrane protease subunit (stomatin/prohibitin family)
MGLIRAFTGAISGTFADQWKDIFTAGQFDEHTVVVPGILQQPFRGRGSSNKATQGVISNGSKIFVPENTAAFIFSQAGIEEIITTPGGYEYQHGQESVFNDGGTFGSMARSLFDQAVDRIGYGGQTPDQKQIAFVNLREIRGIKFGTRGPLIYNDLFYGVDLEILAFGTFSLMVVDAERFIKNFVPANVNNYTFDNPKARAQILSEFRQSFTDALNTLSTKYRISQLPSQANELAASIADVSSNAGTWNERFGFEVVSVAIENIELTLESREIIKQYSINKMNLRAYDDVSQRASNIAAQQKIAQGVQEHGLGDGGGMLFGMNMAQGMNPQNAAPFQQAASMSFDEQIEAVKKLKGLLDAGILSQEEFDVKKRELMGVSSTKEQMPNNSAAKGNFINAQDSPKWYYVRDGQSYGPFPEAELVVLIKSGILTLDTLVYNVFDSNFGGNWVAAKGTSLINLFGSFAR